MLCSIISTSWLIFSYLLSMYSLDNGLCLAWLFVLFALNNNSLVCHVFVGRYRPDRMRTLHGVRNGAMASSSVRLQPPETFNFKSPDEWPRWRRRFLQFRDASCLGDEGQQKQVSTLLYCMGESAEDILTSTDISTDDRKRFEFVIAKFDSFFKVRKNVIFECARFNHRSQ